MNRFRWITAPRLKTKLAEHAIEKDTDGLPELTAEQLAEQEQWLQEQRRWLEYQQQLMMPVDERTDACCITRSAHYSGMINIHDIDCGTAGLWAVNSSFSCSYSQKRFRHLFRYLDLSP